MKYNYKIIYSSAEGPSRVIGVNASSMIEAAHMANAIQEGMPEEVLVIESIESVDTKRGTNE